MKNSPIGFIDSGVGGLTTVKEVMELLPNEELLFIGDSARNPYGSLPLELVHQYVRQMAVFLVNKGIKLLVIACNTATVSSLSKLQNELSIPVIGVIEAGSEAAVAATDNHQIGVIATEATVNSGEYENKIKIINPEITIYSKAVPKFVELTESNDLDSLETRAAIADELQEFKNLKIDTLVLGCTHYPLLQPVIQEYLGTTIKIVNPSVNSAQQVKSLLQKMKLLNDKKNLDVRHTFFTTGDLDVFQQVATEWLEQEHFVVVSVPVEELVTYGS